MMEKKKKKGKQKKIRSITLRTEAKGGGR
jgi:hypothetical protein